MKPYNLKIKKNKYGAYIELGEEGRGREYVKVPYLAEDAAEIMAETHNGKTFIVRSHGIIAGWIARISCEGVYSRNSEGWAYIYAPDEQNKKVSVIASGNGADGEAGRIGFWADYLLEIQPQTVLYVKPHGGYKTPGYYLHFKKDEVVKIPETDVYVYASGLGGWTFNPDISKFIKIKI